MKPAATSAAYRMADRLADGRLAEIIAEQRAAGTSFEAIARQLHADHGIEVSGTTVANWSRALDLEPAEAAS